MASSFIRYEDQIWRFIVRELDGGQIVCQTDRDDIAVRFCIYHRKPAVVIRCLSDERIHYNC